jgi:hypothetical protein
LCYDVPDISRKDNSTIALVGQIRLARPAVVLPAVVARLRQVSDAEARGRLLTALPALLPQEGIIAMMEKLLEDEAITRES